LVDPRGSREGWWSRKFANKAFGVLVVGTEEDHTASISDLFGPAVVDVSRRVETDARMTVIVVVVMWVILSRVVFMAPRR
jgi:hypothetical protein